MTVIQNKYFIAQFQTDILSSIPQYVDIFCNSYFHFTHLQSDVTTEHFLAYYNTKLTCIKFILWAQSFIAQRWNK